MLRRSQQSNLFDRGPMLTPLIDIIFLVLIFFMVHNGPTPRRLGVQPPAMPNAPQQQEENTLLLVVRPDMSYSIQLQKAARVTQEWHREAASSISALTSATAKQTVIETLRQQLESLENSQKIFSQVRRIRLRADQSLDYGSIIAICNLLYRWNLPLDLDVSAGNWDRS